MNTKQGELPLTFKKQKEKEYSFSKNTKYYEITVYEWNLPAGHSCPGAVQCKVMVDRETGKFTNDSNKYRCYAASAERFPSCRGSRHKNFDYVKNGGVPELPKGCKALRIHMSGDFFSQKYFDMWLQIARENPKVEFWAYTKSINFWVKRINDIPDNLTLTASRGSRFDILIDKFSLKSATVVNPDNPAFKFITRDTAIYNGKTYPIDFADEIARTKNRSFLLLDNFVKPKPEKDLEDTKFINGMKINSVNNPSLFSDEDFAQNKYKYLRL